MRLNHPAGPARFPTQATVRLFLLSAALAFLAAAKASAHDPGLSSAELRLGDRELTARLTLARADFDLLAGAREAARGALEVRFDERVAPGSPPEVDADSSSGVSFVLRFPREPGRRLAVRGMLLSRLPPGHRQLVTLSLPGGDRPVQRLLDASSPVLEVDLGAPDALTHLERVAQFERLADSSPSLRFLALGVEHILTGWDHLAFLLALLVACRGFLGAAALITSFSVAHSLTLALSALEIVSIPSAVVEPVIAASIVYVGVESLFRRGRRRHLWILTFAFGLVHGLGFASALRECGLGEGAGEAAVRLLSFNLGVELGQVAAAALALPVLLALDRSPLLAPRWRAALSVVVALLGAFWLAERTILG